MTFTCKCGWLVNTPISVVIKCVNCGATLDCKIDGPEQVGQAGRTAKPPRWTRLVAILRQPQDAGVGDTVQRIAEHFGGERFKRFAERLGIPCGCTNRQEKWNEDFPYESKSTSRSGSTAPR